MSSPRHRCLSLGTLLVLCTTVAGFTSRPKPLLRQRIGRRAAAAAGDVGGDVGGPGGSEPPATNLGPWDEVWDDLAALEAELSLTEAIEQRNEAQLESFVDAQAQWEALVERTRGPALEN